MNTTYLSLAAALMAGPLCVGCEREGPAERAGKQLDEAAASVGEELEDMGDVLEDAADRSR